MYTSKGSVKQGGRHVSMLVVLHQTRAVVLLFQGTRYSTREEMICYTGCSVCTTGWAIFSGGALSTCKRCYWFYVEVSPACPRLLNAPLSLVTAFTCVWDYCTGSDIEKFHTGFAALRAQFLMVEDSHFPHTGTVIFVSARARRTTGPTYLMQAQQ